MQFDPSAGETPPVDTGGGRADRPDLRQRRDAPAGSAVSPAGASRVVVPFAPRGPRARDGVGVEVLILSDLQHQQQQHRAAFDELVARVEATAGTCLYGDGEGEPRQLCFEAYLENPAGFAHLVDTAIAKGRCPVACLVWLVKKGGHRRGAPSAPVNPRTGCTHDDCRYQPACQRPGAAA